MLSESEIQRRQKISKRMKFLRATTLPAWNKGKTGIKTNNKGCTPWNKGTFNKMGILEKHPNWKGGRSITNYGYIRIYKPNYPGVSSNGYILEHRFIMAEFLKRPLKNIEHIHHVNKNRMDNRIENLCLISNSKHNKIHFPHGFNPNRKIT